MRRIKFLIYAIMPLLFLSCGMIKVNIVGYPKLDVFEILFTEKRVIRVDGKKELTDNIRIFPGSRSALINDNSFNFKKIVIADIEKLTAVTCRYGTQRYRGSFEIFNDRDKLLLVNRLNLNDYFAAVLGAEMGDDFSDAALTAQSIAMKSYYFARIKKYKKEKYEINNADGIDMVYRGADFTSDRIYDILKKTEDIYLTDGSKIALSLFHSTSGGLILKDEVMDSKMDEKIEEPVLLYDSADNGEPLPINSPFYNFDLKLSEKELIDILYPDIALNGISGIRVKYFEGTECIDFIGFTDNNNETSFLKGYRFVSLAQKKQYRDLRSIQFKIEKISDIFYIKGKGFGHLCGMSQYSAETLSRKGFGYDEILHFYYPQFKIRKISKLELFFRQMSQGTVL